MLRGIKYNNGTLKVMNQILLPMKVVFIEVRGIEDAWMLINKMLVTGETAPAIVGNLALAIELNKEPHDDKKTFRNEIEAKLNYLLSSKPYSPAMKVNCERMITLANSLYKDAGHTLSSMKLKFIKTLEGSLSNDFIDNTVIGTNGAKFLSSHCLRDKNATILTHGHTGSLATGGWGTALGVVRSLYKMKKLDHVYFTETRLFNIGAHISAFELLHDQLPVTLIIDSSVGGLMKKCKITAVIVGAFSIAPNGDITNEPGTYQLAVLAKYHNVPFYVAAPTSAFKHFWQNDGDDRAMSEEVNTSHTITARGMPCWHPNFDLIPAHFISLIITEKGVYKPEEIIKLKF